jgi:hypothetical protein
MCRVLLVPADCLLPTAFTPFPSAGLPVTRSIGIRDSGRGQPKHQLGISLNYRHSLRVKWHEEKFENGKPLLSRR